MNTAFDAPYVLAYLGIGAVALFVAAAVTGTLGFALGGVWLLASTASYLYSTRVGKFVVWSEILREMGLRGDEHLLDIGCGRGAVLLMAAQLLPRGKAVGVELWRTSDQSGNSMEATLRNAEREGVRNRVELWTADMRNLPFADEGFDVVVAPSRSTTSRIRRDA